MKNFGDFILTPHAPGNRSRLTPLTQAIAFTLADGCQERWQDQEQAQNHLSAYPPLTYQTDALPNEVGSSSDRW